MRRMMMMVLVVSCIMILGWVKSFEGRNGYFWVLTGAPDAFWSWGSFAYCTIHIILNGFMFEPKHYTVVWSLGGFKFLPIVLM